MSAVKRMTGAAYIAWHDAVLRTAELAAMLCELLNRCLGIQQVYAVHQVKAQFVQANACGLPLHLQRGAEGLTAAGVLVESLHLASCWLP